MKSLTILLLSFLISSQYYSQTVNLGNIEVSIGDSLEQVLDHLTKLNYHFKLDTSKYSIRCIIFKNAFNSSRF